MRIRLLPLLGSCLLAVPSLSAACCALGTANVKFSGQTNLIVWDAKHGIEHFVRDAHFISKGPSVAFLAPTPSRPDVQAASAKAFELVRNLTDMPTKSAIRPGTGGLGNRSVEVLEVKEVSGYEATVLRASDAATLADWLRARHFPMTKGVEAWLKPYVKRGWYLTAFKVSLRNHSGATGPVRLSFRTDRPFNPYSVPKENTGRSPLEIFYVSSTLDEPKLGGKTPWPKRVFMNMVPDYLNLPLANALGLRTSDLPKQAIVQRFVDKDFSRAGYDDLYFAPGPRQVWFGSPASRPPHSRK